MRNVIDIEHYMRFDVGAYLKEACEMFAATNPSMGSDALAYTLLDHAFLKMCGYLEQKLTYMSWFLGYHNIENAFYIHKIDFYKDKMDIGYLNKLFLKYEEADCDSNKAIKVRGKVSSFIYFMYQDSECFNNTRTKVASIVKYGSNNFESILNYTGLIYSNYVSLLSRYQYTESKDSFVRGACKEEVFKEAYKEAIEYRNSIAHNLYSMFETRSKYLFKCELSVQPKLGAEENIYKRILIIIFLNELLKKRFLSFYRRRNKN